MKNYTEEWTAIVNKSRYTLNENEAKVLQDEIAAGNRGIVIFKNFAINIAYLEEFYLSGKVYKTNYMLPSNTVSNLSDEENEKVLQAMKDFRANSRLFKEKEIN